MVSLASTSVLLLLLCSGAALASAHMCLFDPPQRGPLHLDTPGDASCKHFGPDVCGSVAAGAVVASYEAGSNVILSFQQNLNHFASAPTEKGTPGFFSVQVAPGSIPVESQFADIAGQILDINVMDEVWMGNFTFNATMPAYTCDPCTLRVQYSPSGSTNISNNFIQCADIAITPAADRRHPQRHVHKLPKHKAPTAAAPLNPATTDCCAPKQFESKFVESSSDGSLSYDAVNQLIAFTLPQDTPADGNPGGQAGGFYMHYVNFSSTEEFVVDSLTGVCSMHTTDQWEDFCFGSSENELFERVVTIAGQSVNMYINKAANFFFGAATNSCLPVIRERARGEMMIYFDTSLGIADPAVFLPPASCNGVKASPRPNQHHAHKQVHKIKLAGMPGTKKL